MIALLQVGRSAILCSATGHPCSLYRIKSDQVRRRSCGRSGGGELREGVRRRTPKRSDRVMSLDVGLECIGPWGDD